MILVRLLPDGSPDPTFATGGVILARVSARVSGVAVVQGRILVVAQPQRPHGRAGIFSFTAAGALDDSYGYGGFAEVGVSAPV